MNDAFANSRLVAKPTPMPSSSAKDAASCQPQPVPPGDLLLQQADDAEAQQRLNRRVQRPTQRPQDASGLGLLGRVLPARSVESTRLGGHQESRKCLSAAVKISGCSECTQCPASLMVNWRVRGKSARMGSAYSGST